MNVTNINTHFKHKTLICTTPLHVLVGRRGNNSPQTTSNSYPKHTLGLKPHTKARKRNQENITSVYFCRKMTKGGKSAARDFTEDPDFVMMEETSPPQGQKRNESNKN
jgi:hypothetical protein